MRVGSFASFGRPAFSCKTPSKPAHGCGFFVRRSRGPFQPQPCMHCMQSKTNLCTLYKNTTPKKTAYNAYKNENRRVRRAEGTKMYAYGNAYRTHTKCIQAHKKRKREKILLLPPLYIVCSFIFHCPRFFRQSFLTVRVFGHVRTPSTLIARLCRHSSTPVFADNGFFRAFFARLTDYLPSSPCFPSCDYHAFLRGMYAFSSVSSIVSFRRTIGICMHCMQSKTNLCTL